MVTQVSLPLLIAPTALAVAAGVSLISGKTLSLWPKDGRILDSRSLQPTPYWIAVGFLATMAVASALMAFYFHSGPITPAMSAQPGLIGAVIVVPIGLNVGYYWMKSKAADRSTWRRFYFVAFCLMGTVVFSSEIFSLQVPDPFWKIPLIPIGAAVLAYVFAAFRPAAPESHF